MPAFSRRLDENLYSGFQHVFRRRQLQHRTAATEQTDKNIAEMRIDLGKPCCETFCHGSINILDNLAQRLDRGIQIRRLGLQELISVRCSTVFLDCRWVHRADLLYFAFALPGLGFNLGDRRLNPVFGSFRQRAVVLGFDLFLATLHLKLVFGKLQLCRVKRLFQVMAASLEITQNPIHLLGFGYQLHFGRVQIIAENPIPFILFRQILPFKCSVLQFPFGFVPLSGDFVGFLSQLLPLLINPIPFLRLTALVRYGVFPAMSEIILPDFQCSYFLVLLIPRRLCLRQFQLPFVNPVFVADFLLTQ